jgi:hypothetical protein
MTEQYPENMDAKVEEIKAYILDRIEEIADYELEKLQEPYDLGHEIYNTDYYIIGTWQAKQWLGSDVFEVIEAIKYYEQSEFGEVSTDFSSPEAIVNMFVYIVGDRNICEMVEEYIEDNNIVFDFDDIED